MNTLASLGRLVVAASLSALVFGCASETADDAMEPTEGTEAALGVAVPNPSGAYFASVSANGMGCPAGSWDANISRDGKRVSVKFSSYVAEVEEDMSFSIRDCTISISLRTPRGFSFAVDSFDYAGEARLDQGVRASISTKYYFQGNPITASNRYELDSSSDGRFVIEDKVAQSDRAWSPCGTSRNLNVQTSVTLRNRSDREGSGRVDINKAWSLSLDWRRC